MMATGVQGQSLAEATAPAVSGPSRVSRRRQHRRRCRFMLRRGSVGAGKLGAWRRMPRALPSQASLTLSCFAVGVFVVAVVGVCKQKQQRQKQQEQQRQTKEKGKKKRFRRMVMLAAKEVLAESCRHRCSFRTVPLSSRRLQITKAIIGKWDLLEIIFLLLLLLQVVVAVVLTTPMETATRKWKSSYRRRRLQKQPRQSPAQTRGSQCSFAFACRLAATGGCAGCGACTARLLSRGPLRCRCSSAPNRTLPRKPHCTASPTTTATTTAAMTAAMMATAAVLVPKSGCCSSLDVADATTPAKKRPYRCLRAWSPVLRRSRHPSLWSRSRRGHCRGP
mmetsp:Transcript_69499/g.139866  ORF Transcript_69499/g.139866 Transcript_69499/m.139866 type:complete len:335 (-) Transcript_69499:735-1739(-)